MSKQVQIDIILPQSPEQVWQAITDSRVLAQWLMPNDFRPRIGHRFRFTPKRTQKGRDRKAIECEVVELEAPHRLVYTWRENPTEAPDLVTWALEPVEAGTRVRLEHTRLTDLRASAISSGVKRRSLPSSACVMARLARYLTEAGSRARLKRGKVTLSAGSAFTCTALTPSATLFEETLA